MGGKSSSPDYGQAAIAQGEANAEVNRAQTYANRPDQVTPWGSETWSNEAVIDPATGERVTQWTQNTALRGDLTDMLNRQIALGGSRTELAQGLTERMFDEFGSPIDYGGLTPMGERPYEQFTTPESVQRNLNMDPTQQRKAAEDAYYNKAASRFLPQQEAATEAMEIKLRNQGLSPEDQVYKTQMQGLKTQQADQMNQVQFDATRAGLGEQAQAWGQGVQQGQFFNQSGQQAFGQQAGANQQNYQQAMQSSQYANQLRQQQIAEAQGLRGQSLNEINALISGQQVAMPQMPGFTNANAAQAAPIYQGAVDQGNMSQMQGQGLSAGLGGLAQAGISAYTGGLI